MEQTQSVGNGGGAGARAEPSTDVLGTDVLLAMQAAERRLEASHAACAAMSLLAARVRAGHNSYANVVGHLLAEKCSFSTITSVPTLLRVPSCVAVGVSLARLLHACCSGC